MRQFKFGDPVWAWNDVTRPACKGFFVKSSPVGDDRDDKYCVMTGVNSSGWIDYDYYLYCCVRKPTDTHAPKLPFGTYVYNIHADNGLVYDFGVYSGLNNEDESHRIFVNDGASGRVVRAHVFTTENP